MQKFNIWCVRYGLAGCYMPDSIYYWATLKEAESDAAQQAKDSREYGDKVQGSARDRYYDVGEYSCIVIAHVESFATKHARDLALESMNQYC